MIRKLSFTTILVALILSACQVKEKPDWQDELANNPDPLSALQSAARSQLYTSEYWLQVKTVNAELWKHAANFCRYHTEYPNCIPVSKHIDKQPVQDTSVRYAKKKKRKAKSSKAKSSESTKKVAKNIKPTDNLKRKISAKKKSGKKAKSKKKVAKSGVKELPEK